MSIRMRHTKGHTGNRRSHHALKNKLIVVDKESGKLRLPHRLDESTGMYRGKLIVTPKTKETKLAKRAERASHEKHAHTHAPVEEKKGSKGILGKITGGARPKARSGAGGGGV